MSRGYFLCVIICAFVLFRVEIVFTHVCMIWPPQRGGWNAGAAKPGDDKCFQPQQPCGVLDPPSAPTDTFFTGTTAYIIFQQNLNHYNPGWPGFLDIAYAKGPSHKTDDEFTVLAQIPDYWSHSQASQTNFSVPIQIPDLECDWCTLRIRYHPNKLTEPIFHNCGDVRFVKNNQTVPQRLFGFVVPSRNSIQTTLSEILPNGKISPLSVNIDILKRDANAYVWGGRPDVEQFLAQGLVAPHLQSQSVYFIGDDFSVFELGNSPSVLYRYDVKAGNLEKVAQLTRSGLQWDALIPTSNALIAIQQRSNGLLYEYITSSISFTGEVTDIGGTVANDTFVNFLWADVDENIGHIYILAGDENSLYTLNAVLYVVSTCGTYWVKPDNSKYTLFNLHVDQSSGKIYSVTNGLYGENNWSIVIVDYMTGNVTLKSKINSPAEFSSSLRGSIYNGIRDGKILHAFQWKLTGATVVALIDIETGTILHLTDIDLGINSEMDLNYLFSL